MNCSRIFLFERYLMSNMIVFGKQLMVSWPFAHRLTRRWMCWQRTPQHSTNIQKLRNVRRCDSSLPHHISYSQLGPRCSQATSDCSMAKRTPLTWPFPSWSNSKKKLETYRPWIPSCLIRGRKWRRIDIEFEGSLRYVEADCFVVKKLWGRRKKTCLKGPS